MMRHGLQFLRGYFAVVSIVLLLTVFLFAAAQSEEPPTGEPAPTSVEPAPEAQPDPSPGDVQERAVRRDQLEQQGTSYPSQKTRAPAGQPAPKVMVPGTGPTTGTLALPQPAPATGTGGPSSVVGGTLEPDYRYPWVVQMNGCRGVLIDPQWVLTAAHCVTPNIGFGKLIYSRTDPHTGAVQTETRAPAPVGLRLDGVFLHQMYNPSQDFANDIALIKLAQPFTINPYIQTVALPRSQRPQGVVGTVASFLHTGPLPAGQVAIFRAPIPPADYPPKMYITAMAANASLCKGDSGSGFVTVENGRATVRGIASQANTTNCMTPNGEAVFTDVFTFHDWILQTTGKSDASLSGNTRVRWSGRAARGGMRIACFNPYGTLWGPLNVVGVEEGAVCEPGQTQTVICNLEKNQASVSLMMVPTLSGLTMRTTMANGASNVQTLPASGNTASFFGLLPAGASREFTCQIGTPFMGATTGTNASVLSRGLEGESAGEPTVDQPSPFDPSEETTPKQKEKGQTP